MNFTIDVIGIGFPKCGTTWVSRMLSEHPEICMAEAKETFFFIKNEDEFRKDITGFRRIASWDMMKNQFADHNKVKAEFSTMYIFDKEALQAILHHNPKVKILVCLRPPWDFLFSAYQFDKNSNFGHLIEHSFRDYLNNWSKLSLIKKEWADYIRYMRDLYEIFSTKQIHLIFVSEIKRNNKIVLGQLWRFLELSNIDFIPDSIDEKINETKEMRSRFIQRLSNKVLEHLQSFPVGRYILYNFIHKRGAIRKALFLVLKKNKKKVQLHPDIAAQLRTDYYECINELHVLTGDSRFLNWLK